MLPDLSAFQAELVQIPARKDNYIYLLRDHRAGVMAVIDPADAAPVLEALTKRDWRLDELLITHHHADHTGGNLELKAATGCRITGYASDAARIPGIDRRVEEDEVITVGRFEARVMFLPGHTFGHIAYYFPQLRLLFSGDVLFSLGCGRLFEGTADQMFASLQKIAALPEKTWICCAHEYTEANGAFALTMERGNAALQERVKEVARLRTADQPTIPMLLGEEKKTNPFLRPFSQEIRQHLGMASASDEAVFAELRRRKDNF